MGILKIERTGGGGFAAPNLPGSPFVSWGEKPMGSLSIADQEAIEELFKHPPHEGPAQQRDPESFRITRTNCGHAETIEVPEALVPSALKACVTDRLK